MDITHFNNNLISNYFSNKKKIIHKSYDCENKCDIINFQQQKKSTKIFMNILYIEQIIFNLTLIIFLTLNEKIICDKLFNSDDEEIIMNNSNIYKILDKNIKILNHICFTHKKIVLLKEGSMIFKNSCNDQIKSIDLSFLYLTNDEENIFVMKNYNEINCDKDSNLFLSKITVLNNNFKLLKKYICFIN
jgi:hypothetical protein